MAFLPEIQANRMGLQLPPPRDLAAAGPVPLSGPGPATMFINFDGAELNGQREDARSNSTLIGFEGTFEPYGDSGAKRAAVLQAVREDWEAFDMAITDMRPAEGDYTMSNVAAELIRCLDHLSVDRFRLAGHDWGVAIGDHVVDQIPNRVERYMRCCLSLHDYDPRNSLHHIWNSKNPEAARTLKL